MVHSYQYVFVGVYVSLSVCGWMCVRVCESVRVCRCEGVYYILMLFNVYIKKRRVL